MQLFTRLINREKLTHRLWFKPATRCQPSGLPALGDPEIPQLCPWELLSGRSAAATCIDSWDAPWPWTLWPLSAHHPSPSGSSHWTPHSYPQPTHTFGSCPTQIHALLMKLLIFSLWGEHRALVGNQTLFLGNTNFELRQIPRVISQQHPIKQIPKGPAATEVACFLDSVVSLKLQPLQYPSFKKINIFWTELDNQSLAI